MPSYPSHAHGLPSLIPILQTHQSHPFSMPITPIPLTFAWPCIAMHGRLLFIPFSSFSLLTSSHPLPYPLGVLKNLVSGAKRGFSDAIDGGSGKWIFSGSGGSETDLAKGGGLFSPRGGNGGGKHLGGSESNDQHSSLGTPVKNDVVSQSPKPSMRKSLRFLLLLQKHR